MIVNELQVIRDGDIIYHIENYIEPQKILLEIAFSDDTILEQLKVVPSILEEDK